MVTQTLAKLQQAVRLIQSGDAAGALALCDAALSQSPGEPEALHLLAMALARLGRFDEAAPAFEAAARVHPRKDAILVNYGNAMKAAGRIDAAREAYRRATKAAPRSATAWNALGLIERQCGDPVAAQAAFEKALAAQPGYAGAYNNLGMLQMSQGREVVAAETLTKAVSLAPDMVAARLNRGAVLRKLGRVEDAVKDHERAVALAPGLAEAQYQLGASLAAAGDFEGAAARFRRALQIDMGRTDVHRDLARVLWELGRRAESFEALDAAIERNATPALLVLRGELSLLSGDPRNAEAAARRALALTGDHPAALGLLARLAAQRGDSREALDLAEKACGRAPDDFALRHQCAEIELANGRYEAARARLSGEAPVDHRQKHLALRALAQRALGDDEYKRLYDYDRFTAQIAIDPPDGYASIEAFNAALQAAIEPLHRTKNAPLDQTLYGGTQSAGRLWAVPDPVIQAYVAAMLQAARRYVASLPDDPTHPFLARKSANLACAGAWSVILSSGGGHVDHIHPAGWVSACYYVHAPESVLAGDDRAGFLRLGGSGVRGLDLPAERWFRPIPGTVVFFPSYIWHGVEPFAAAGRRVTAPFDLAPA